MIQDFDIEPEKIEECSVCSCLCYCCFDKRCATYCYDCDCGDIGLLDDL